MRFMLAPYQRLGLLKDHFACEYKRFTQISNTYRVINAVYQSNQTPNTASSEMTLPTV